MVMRDKRLHQAFAHQWRFPAMAGVYQFLSIVGSLQQQAAQLETNRMRDFLQNLALSGKIQFKFACTVSTVNFKASCSDQGMASFVSHISFLSRLVVLGFLSAGVMMRCELHPKLHSFC